MPEEETVEEESEQEGPTIGDYLKIRNALRVGKRQNAFDSNVQLAYAVDKSLRKLNQELEEYDDKEEEIREEHAKRDGEDRVLWRNQNGDHLLKNEDGEFVYAEAGEGHQKGDVFTKPGEGDPVFYTVDDQDELDEDLDSLRDREEKIDLHQIEWEIFREHADLQGIHHVIDLVDLDLFFKEDKD